MHTFSQCTISQAPFLNTGKKKGRIFKNTFYYPLKAYFWWSDHFKEIASNKLTSSNFYRFQGYVKLNKELETINVLFRPHDNTLLTEGNLADDVKGFLQSLEELQGSSGGESHQNDMKKGVTSLETFVGVQNGAPLWYVDCFELKATWEKLLHLP